METKATKKVTITDQYRAGFEKHYPQKKLEIKRDNSKKDAPHFWVVIDGDRGDRSYNLGELIEAINLFNR